MRIIGVHKNIHTAHPAILIFLFSALLFSGLKAQDFNFTPSKYHEAIYGIKDTAIVTIYFTNNTGSTADLAYEVLENSLIGGWRPSLCTHLGCFTNVPSNFNFGNLANGNTGYFRIYSYFSGITGKGTLKMRLFDMNDPSISDTVTYILVSGTPLGNSMKIDEISIRLYPNPVNDLLIIEGIDILGSKMVVYDNNGKLMKLKEVLNNQEIINLQGWNNGIYILRLVKDNTTILNRIFVMSK